MKSDTPIFVGLGFTQHCDDPKLPPEWHLITYLRMAGFTNIRMVECIQNGDKSAMTFADIAWAKLIFVYSWSLESLRKLTHDFADLRADQVVVVVTGVQDPNGLARRTIDMSRFNGQAICFQVTPDLAYPVSVPIGWASWVDFRPDAGYTSRSDNFWNVNCNKLAKPIPWWEKIFFGLINSTKIWNHCNVLNNADLLVALVRLAVELEG